MNSKILPIFLSLFITVPAAAQSAFQAFAIMDANNIRVQHNVQSGNWQDSTTASAAEFPRASGNYIGADAALWLTGMKNGNTLANSSTVGNQSDFWPGPWVASLDPQIRNASSARWNKIWSISKTAVDSFRQQFGTATPYVPAEILFWPAKGNIDAKDALGNQLIILTDRAPFVDVDSNGKYEPFKGDYPLIKGDKMHWWIINDNGFSHDTGAVALDVEVAHTAYAFDRWTNLRNIIFYEYEITAKGSATINNFRAGFYEDFDIGDGTDDVPGYDSARRLAYMTNKTATDNVYGSNIPVAGALVLEYPGDSYTNRSVIGAMTFWKNDLTIYGLPKSARDKDNVMRQKLNGNNGPSVFPGSNYTTCNFATLGSDYKFITASPDRNLLPNTTLKFAMALIAAEDAGGCPNTSLVRFKQTADTAWKVYWNGTTTVTGIASNPTKPVLLIYPNPAKDKLIISANNGEVPNEIVITDLAGRSIQVAFIRMQGKAIADISGLVNGVYVVKAGTITQRIVVMH